MADFWRDFWIRETGTGQQAAQLHDRYMMMMMKLVKTLTDMVTSFFQGIIQAVAQENQEETRLCHLVPWLRELSTVPFKCKSIFTYDLNWYLKVFPPTDAQLDSLQNNSKFVLKLTLKSSYMF